MNVEGFDSIESLFDAMHQAEQDANLTLAPEQQTLTWGSYLTAFIPEASQLLVVFGRCWTAQEWLDSERRAMLDQGDDPIEPVFAAELEAVHRQMLDAHERGYLFGRYYSVVEPTGELGSLHRSRVWPTSELLFLAAQQAQWRISELRPAEFTELNAAYQAFAAHVRSFADD